MTMLSRVETAYRFTSCLNFNYLFLDE